VDGTVLLSTSALHRSDGEISWLPSDPGTLGVYYLLDDIKIPAKTTDYDTRTSFPKVRLGLMRTVHQLTDGGYGHSG
jgi:hypothetical protein